MFYGNLIGKSQTAQKGSCILVCRNPFALDGQGNMSTKSGSTEVRIFPAIAGARKRRSNRLFRNKKSRAEAEGNDCGSAQAAEQSTFRNKKSRTEGKEMIAGARKQRSNRLSEIKSPGQRAGKYEYEVREQERSSLCYIHHWKKLKNWRHSRGLNRSRQNGNVYGYADTD